MKKIQFFLIYLRKIVILYKTDCYLYTTLVVKSLAFLEEKFLQDEIAALSSKSRNDREIKINNIYLKTIVKEIIPLIIPSLKPL